MFASAWVRRSAAGGLVAWLFALVLSTGVEASGKAEEAKRYMEQLKTTTDAKKKAEAIEELGKLGQILKSLVEPAVPDIRKALDDKDPTVRRTAALAYGRLDQDPKVAVPLLTKLLKDDKDESVRLGAAQGLAAMRDNAKAALPDLQQIARELKEDKKSKLGRAAGDAAAAIQSRK
jgi:HEAT repeat protein